MLFISAIFFRRGALKDFFDIMEEEEAEDGTLTKNTAIKEHTKLDQTVFADRNCAKNIEFVQNQGLEVDDDNDPVPENIQLLNQTQINHELKEGQKQGSHCTNQQLITGTIVQSIKFHGGWTPKQIPILKCLCSFCHGTFCFNNHPTYFQCTCCKGDASFDGQQVYTIYQFVVSDGHFSGFALANHRSIKI